MLEDEFDVSDDLPIVPDSKPWERIDAMEKHNHESVRHLRPVRNILWRI